MATQAGMSRPARPPLWTPFRRSWNVGGPGPAGVSAYCRVRATASSPARIGAEGADSRYEEPFADVGAGTVGDAVASDGVPARTLTGSLALARRWPLTADRLSSVPSYL